MIKHEYIDEWTQSIIQHPVIKRSIELSNSRTSNGFYDFRTLLQNTHGFETWKVGQNFFENWEIRGTGYTRGKDDYLAEIAADSEIYEQFPLVGSILDVGGLSGTVRHFLSKNSQYICLDPFEDAPHAFTPDKAAAYKCLSSPYNFVIGNAEFLPFKENSFDIVHMRSMLDHVQVPDLALLEAHRVLKSNGRLLVGMTVEGGKDGKRSIVDKLKDFTRNSLGFFGFERFLDHHTWHPTYKGLIKLAADNDFVENKVFWQSKWNGRVVYVEFKKRDVNNDL